MPGFCFYKEFFMAIEDFVRDFNRRLDDAIGRAMEGDVADAVRAAIVSAVESEVYSEKVYKRSEDHPYIRRDDTGEPGGLQDWNVMEAKYDPSTMTLEVQDRSRDRDSGRLIAPVVESGKGYQGTPVPSESAGTCNRNRACAGCAGKVSDGKWIQGEGVITIDAKTAQENNVFPALFLPRVGFGAGFSKNAENQHTGQNACFDDNNSQKQRKRLEIIRIPVLIIWWR